MADASFETLRGLRLLVAEDEYIIASNLTFAFEALGIEVVGPVGFVKHALELVEANPGRLDAAILDVNLNNERVFPVATALAARHIPFMFTTGYDGSVIPAAFAAFPRFDKPVPTALLIRALIEIRQLGAHLAPSSLDTERVRDVGMVAEAEKS
jgi:CheY-like chemotaxis protein